MILTCEKCQTKYKVAADSIPSAGRKVKCVKCKHIWTQLPEGASQDIMPEPKGVKAIPRGGALPVVQKSGAPFGLKAAAIALLVVSLSATFTLYQRPILKKAPFLNALYNVVGLQVTDGVTLENLAIAKRSADGKTTEYVLSGMLINKAKAARILPNLKISLLDDAKKEITSFTLKSTGESLKPGAGMEFVNPLANLPEKTKFLSIDLGNKAELLLR